MGRGDRRRSFSPETASPRAAALGCLPPQWPQRRLRARPVHRLRPQAEAAGGEGRLAPCVPQPGPQDSAGTSAGSGERREGGVPSRARRHAARTVLGERPAQCPAVHTFSLSSVPRFPATMSSSVIVPLSLAQCGPADTHTAPGAAPGGRGGSRKQGRGPWRPVGLRAEWHGDVHIPSQAPELVVGTPRSI